jgi:hypothetical protein
MAHLRAQIENGVVQNIAVMPGEATGEDVPEAFADWVLCEEGVEIGFLYDGTTFTDPTPPPDPAEVLDAERAAMVVSRFQAKAALNAAGLLPQVEAAIAQADTFVQIAWADAVEFRRNSPTIAALKDAVGLTDEQLDDLFRAGAQIEA